MRHPIIGLPILALLLAGPAAGQSTRLIARDIFFPTEDTKPLADFRLDPPPAMEQVEKTLLDFARTEALHLSNQKNMGEPSLALLVNRYTTIFILQPQEPGPLLFALRMERQHEAEKPAQLALFERLKAKLRGEFPNLTIE